MVREDLSKEVTQKRNRNESCKGQRAASEKGPEARKTVAGAAGISGKSQTVTCVPV